MTKKLLLLAILLLVTTPAFSQLVDTAWVRRYNGPGNDIDAARAIAVDGSGNVYVTGRSGAYAIHDYATIRYYPDANTAWVRRYDGPGNGDDWAVAMTVDESGNVYVTGYSYGSGTGVDYATIKYYPNGDTAWVRRYNGPGNDYDEARAIAVDSSGNVYVTGLSYGGAATNYDYATIKYYPNGDTAWVRRYDGLLHYSDGAVAIAINENGNVYVTGYSYGAGLTDYATIKYYPNGDTAWVRRYDGTGSNDDLPHSIVVDRSGNVYVTGQSQGDGTNSDYATIKYYSNGDTAWVRRYNGPGNDRDEATAIAVDGSNNVYVTGFSFGSGTGPDYATIKYYSNGDTAWVRRYTGSGSDWDYACAIAVDASGCVYVTGGSVGSGTGYDYATIKYYPNGDTTWVRRYNGPGNDYDGAEALTLDGSGNVYVTGASVGSGTNYDYATIKYVQFLRGDCDKNGNIDLVDVILLANYVLKGGPAPNPLQSGDVNCDGKYDLVDVIKLARYILFGELFPC